MSDTCNSCPSKGQCDSNPAECGVEIKESLAGSLNNIKNVIVVMSGKGGVGKSSVTALIASELARAGKKVGVLDADITGPSQPRAFGLTNPAIKGTDYGIIPPQTKTGIKLISINFFLPHEDDPVIWRGPVLAGAVKQFWEEVDWRELDYLVVDLPPGTGDVPLTVMQTLPVKGIVIVSSPQELAVMVVKKTIKMAKKMNIPILGLVENMSYAICSHCNEKLKIFGESQGENVAKMSDIDFLGGLPWDARLNQLVDQGKIEDYDSEDIKGIVARITAKLD
jgi:Mrp family chromosome partitioning ATPase